MAEGGPDRAGEPRVPAPPWRERSGEGRLQGRQDFLKALARLLLAPKGLAPSTAPEEAFRAGVAAAAGRHGLVEEIVHDGDPREPATLHALFASPGAPSTRGTLLFLHGKGGCGAEWRRDAVRALRLGWNVLVPELRGHAPSTGTRVTYGHFEKVDLAVLVAGAQARFGLSPDRLGIDGCSMGAVVALAAAAETLRPRALWLQSPFGDLPAMAVHYVSRATGLPRWLVSRATLWALASLGEGGGFDLASIDPVAAARRVTCKTIVVHGEEDTLTPPRFSPAIYEALAGEKELWLVPRCGHCHHPDEPQAIRSAEYVRRWTAFFGGALSSAP